ncbi:GNAT family N-acetyltransferase [Microvirga subterranea]|uniref:Ribosomal protein S18 acetylase RimI-like enzyme n=1 Tax=Microvirga subterranea TaxID=186651 RepID=A0A370HRM2_9HYPH|nr:GNAT family N-acetyltransferase [Microvirga subterranea]RDI60935.1 ribosomal protein S18 acetylase RimI-like enzyme [Microvirga subterranea]
MTPSFTVRRLDPSDAEDYRAIRLKALLTAPEAFGSVHAVESARPLEDFAERLASSAVFGAYRDGRILGMAGFKQETGLRDGHKGFVWGFFVAPEARGQGVGAALMEALVAHASDVVEQLTLAVVSSNAGAIALYERFGFRSYGVEPRALKGPDGYADEVLMVRFLRDPKAG